MEMQGMVDKVTTSVKAVAFTFDDGPNPVYTPQLLSIFREWNGKATFFMIGEQIERNPETARSVHEEGHEIGNHTYTHPNLTELKKDDILEEIDKTEQLIAGITGAKPAVLRPPYLASDERLGRLAASRGYRLIGAVNPGVQDWDMPGVQHILDKTREHLGPGSILLFHDGYGDRSQTIEAVSVLVPVLVKQGYRLVTVSELLALEGVRA
ncbi:polysaccharide deacetylase family protein [Paenibacillus protaetiae]|uniref:Polysaccharide deacetylase family protein n=1 Tax=Paenibacillus protaetiae TaxID=2509456 RepID=A0A4P6EUY6_9BACL|nr:polysaccharide deacetylase family protein [Paenibacillus protaetiae]QAY66496.1 polysaccharide deacetylase family protein [Paenibacillus protaetiae]